jgi:hypothetical protein
MSVAFYTPIRFRFTLAALRFDGLGNIQEVLHRVGDIITSREVTEAGFHRGVLEGLVEEKELMRVSRGVYMKATAWEDEMSPAIPIRQRRFFARNSPLSHGVSDRTPARFTMTFPWGYNVPSLKGENVTVKRSVKDLYVLGVIEMQSPAGKAIRAYDIKRTLCDIVRKKTPWIYPS